MARKSQILKQVLFSSATTDDHDDCAVSIDTRKWPEKIIYPTDWFPVKDEGQQKMVEAFLEALEQVLGVTHTKISLEEEWARSGPDGLRDQILEHYLDKVGAAKLQQRFYANDESQFTGQIITTEPTTLMISKNGTKQNSNESHT